MKKMLIAITAFAATVAVAPAPALAATGHANYVEQINDSTKAEQGVKQRRHHAGRHHRWRWRTVCRRHWRHGRPHRVCRRVRVRW